MVDIKPLAGRSPFWWVDIKLLAVLKAGVKCLMNSFFSSEIQDLHSFPKPPFKRQVRLNANESPYRTSSKVSYEISRQIGAAELNRYPDPYACELRGKIGENIGFDRDWILVGNGSDEIISILITAFGKRPGKVCFPVPTFPMYHVCTVCEKQNSMTVPLTPLFDIDLEQFLGRVDEEKPDLIVFAFPNNPTGNCFSQDSISRVIDEVSCPVVLDEAYYEFSKKTFLPKLKTAENLIVVRTFSKIGFAGIRLGYMLGHPHVISNIQKAKLPFNVNSITQEIGKVVLSNWDSVLKSADEIVQERQRVFDALKTNSALTTFKSDANFIMFKPCFSPKGLMSFLESNNVFIKSLGGSLEGYMRVTIGTGLENDIFLSYLKKYTDTM